MTVEAWKHYSSKEWIEFAVYWFNHKRQWPSGWEAAMWRCLLRSACGDWEMVEEA